MRNQKERAGPRADAGSPSWLGVTGAEGAGTEDSTTTAFAGELLQNSTCTQVHQAGLRGEAALLWVPEHPLSPGCGALLKPAQLQLLPQVTAGGSISAKHP